jgi:hypothetical protein
LRYKTLPHRPLSSCAYFSPRLFIIHRRRRSRRRRRNNSLALGSSLGLFGFARCRLGRRLLCSCRLLLRRRDRLVSCRLLGQHSSLLRRRLLRRSSLLLRRSSCRSGLVSGCFLRGSRAVVSCRFLSRKRLSAGNFFFLFLSCYQRSGFSSSHALLFRCG